MKLYGLKNCDSCKKALKVLRSNGYQVDFFDIRIAPLDDLQIQLLLNKHGESILVNRKSTTWRELNEVKRAWLPLDLLRECPTLIKRPVIYDSVSSYVGWTKDVQAALNL